MVLRESAFLALLGLWHRSADSVCTCPNDALDVIRLKFRRSDRLHRGTRRRCDRNDVRYIFSSPAGGID